MIWCWNISIWCFYFFFSFFCFNKSYVVAKDDTFIFFEHSCSFVVFCSVLWPRLTNVHFCHAHLIYAHRRHTEEKKRLSFVPSTVVVGFAFYSNSVNQGICDLDAKFHWRLNIDSVSNTLSFFFCLFFTLCKLHLFFLFSIAQFTKWAFCIENTWKIWMINITFKYLPIWRNIYTNFFSSTVFFLYFSIRLL